MRRMLRIVGGLAVVGGALYFAQRQGPREVIDHRSPFLDGHGSEFTEIAGFRVHHVEEGSGPALILVHGGGTWLYSFRHNLAPLAQTHRVIALDMPGHGYTRRESPGPRYDFETTDRILGGLLDAKGIDKASIVGHSWGGGWALHFAQSHPERVDKLVLIGSSGLPARDRLEWELLKVPLVGDALAALFRRKHVRSGLLAAFADASLVTPEMVDEVYAPVSRPENRRAQVAYARNLDWRETQAQMDRMQTPTLVLWGDQDAYLDIEDGRALAAAIPQALHEVISLAGHNVHEEKPQRVNDSITRFLKEGEDATGDHGR